jgi:uncharacterized protein YraI
MEAGSIFTSSHARVQGDKMGKIAICMNKHTVASALLAMMLALSACNGAGSTKAPTAVITSPTANSEVMAGSEMTIQGQADGQNIIRVDVVIDSAVQGSVAASNTSEGVDTLPVVITWTTQMVGAHFVQLNVYGKDNKVIAKSDAVIFNTKAPAATATPTAPLATPTQAVVPTVAPTAVVTSATTTTETAGTTGTTSAASLTINNDSGYANIRSGPDTTYDLVGKLNQGESAPIKGRNEDGTWWQIAFAAGTGGVGWVRGDLVKANDAATNVPVVAAPPKPTAQPAPPTSSAPTATPPSVAVETIAPAATATPSGPVCDASSPNWRGSNPNYPFCSNMDFNWGQSEWEYTVFDNGRDGAIWLQWNLYGSNVSQVWIHFVHDATICGFDRTAQRQVSEQLSPSTGRYDFNITQFPYGGTYRVYLDIVLTDGRSVQWGEKKLCIR